MKSATGLELAKSSLLCSTLGVQSPVCEVSFVSLVSEKCCGRLLSCYRVRGAIVGALRGVRTVED